MTRITPRKNETRRAWLQTMLIGGYFGTEETSIHAAGSAKNMTTTMKTIWRLVDELAQSLPFSRVQVERIFGQLLTETPEPSNDKFQFLKGGPFHLDDGTEVTVDLRIKRSGGHPGFLVLGLISGTCIPRSDVSRRYPDLTLAGGPRGRSADDAAVFSAQRPWGVLSFSFLESQPDCLASMAFDPTK